MAMLFTLTLCLFLALFFLPFSLFREYKYNIYFIPAFFTLIELLRSTIFTGFPWLSLGYTQVPHSPITGYLPIFGIHGISFLVVLSSILIFRLFEKNSNKVFLLSFLIIIWTGGQALKKIEWTKPKGNPFSVTLIQGNISQDKKWNKYKINESLDHYKNLILKSNASLIILPETSMPVIFSDIPKNFIKNIEKHISNNNSALILGAIELNKNRYYNSAFLIEGKEETQIYRKSHLVPFGEYIPLEEYLGYIYKNWLNIPYSNLQRGQPNKAPLFSFNDKKFAINICYEDVFGNEIISRYSNLPDAYINMSNDAWYGKSIAAQQHLQISQARALETGKMMIRATNTGVTAFIDKNGKVVKKLPQFVSGMLTHEVQGYKGSTPYALFTNLPVYFLCITILLLNFYSTILSFFRKLFSK